MHHRDSRDSGGLWGHLPGPSSFKVVIKGHPNYLNTANSRPALTTVMGLNCWSSVQHAIFNLSILREPCPRLPCILILWYSFISLWDTTFAPSGHAGCISERPPSTDSVTANELSIAISFLTVQHARNAGVPRTQFGINWFKVLQPESPVFIIISAKRSPSMYSDWTSSITEVQRENLLLCSLWFIELISLTILVFCVRTKRQKAYKMWNIWNTFSGSIKKKCILKPC